MPRAFLMTNLRYKQREDQIINEDNENKTFTPFTTDCSVCDDVSLSTKSMDFENSRHLLDDECSTSKGILIERQSGDYAQYEYRDSDDDIDDDKQNDDTFEVTGDPSKVISKFLDERVNFMEVDDHFQTMKSISSVNEGFLPEYIAKRSTETEDRKSDSAFGDCGSSSSSKSEIVCHNNFAQDDDSSSISSSPIGSLAQSEHLNYYSTSIDSDSNISSNNDTKETNTCATVTEYAAMEYNDYQNTRNYTDISHQSTASYYLKGHQEVFDPISDDSNESNHSKISLKDDRLNQELIADSAHLDFKTTATDKRNTSSDTISDNLCSDFVNRRSGINVTELKDIRMSYLYADRDEETSQKFKFHQKSFYSKEFANHRTSESQNFQPSCLPSDQLHLSDSVVKNYCEQQMSKVGFQNDVPSLTKNFHDSSRDRYTATSGSQSPSCAITRDDGSTGNYLRDKSHLAVTSEKPMLSHSPGNCHRKTRSPIWRQFETPDDEKEGEKEEDEDRQQEKEGVRPDWINSTSDIELGATLKKGETNKCIYGQQEVELPAIDIRSKINADRKVFESSGILQYYPGRDLQTRSIEWNKFHNSPIEDIMERDNKVNNKLNKYLNSISAAQPYLNTNKRWNALSLITDRISNKDRYYKMDERFGEYIEKATPVPFWRSQAAFTAIPTWHKNAEINGEPWRSSLPITQDVHVCMDCGKRYSTSSNLARHRQIHRLGSDRHSEKVGSLASRQMPSTSGDSRKARKCPHCDKAYVSMPAYSMHVRTHNQGCACPHCGKRFSRPWLLQGHVRTHTGEKPFSCNVCGKHFADKSNLRAHVQTHSPEKPYLCGRCNKAFALKSYLYKHEESSCMRSPRVFSGLSLIQRGR